MKIENHFRLARNMALKSPSKFRLGAVLVKGRRVLSAGFNQMNKTHTVMARFIKDRNHLIGIHAEIAATVGVAAADLDEATIIVYRVLANGKQALAKPCEMCQKYLFDIGVLKVYYSTVEGYKCLDLI